MKLSGAIDFKPKFFSALRHYSMSRFKDDLVAGVVVGIVALPLAIAFGIASGVSPTIGLITAIIGGFLVSAFGGNSVQIGGPTGAFIVIVYSIIQNFGLEGLAIANGWIDFDNAWSVPPWNCHQVHPLSYSGRIHERYRPNDFFHSDQ